MKKIAQGNRMVLIGEDTRMYLLLFITLNFYTQPFPVGKIQGFVRQIKITQS